MDELGIVLTTTAISAVTIAATVAICAYKRCGFFSTRSIDLEGVKIVEREKAISEYKSYLTSEKNELDAIKTALIESLQAGEIAIKSMKRNYQFSPINHEVSQNNQNFSEIELKFREMLATYPSLKDNPDANGDEILELCRQRREHHKKNMAGLREVIEGRNDKIDGLELKVRAIVSNTYQ